MYVGVAKISLVLDESHSLKDKRMVLRRIKDRVRDRLGVMVNEVGDHELWQRAELGVAVVSGDRTKAAAVLEDVLQIATAAGGAAIVAIAREIQTFAAVSTPYAAIDDRTGAGDKAQAETTMRDWVPDEWRDEASK